MKVFPFVVLVILCFMFSCNVEASCSRDPEQLLVKAKEAFYGLKQEARTQGINIEIICGYRTQQDQNKLYAKGRYTPGKKVTWTRRSRHTQRVAFDVAVFKKYGISWRSKDYIRLGVIAKKFNLTWGGNWKVRDYGHFELN